MDENAVSTQDPSDWRGRNSLVETAVCVLPHLSQLGPRRQLETHEHESEQRARLSRHAAIARRRTSSPRQKATPTTMHGTGWELAVATNSEGRYSRGAAPILAALAAFLASLACASCSCDGDGVDGRGGGGGDNGVGGEKYATSSLGGRAKNSMAAARPGDAGGDEGGASGGGDGEHPAHASHVEHSGNVAMSQVSELHQYSQPSGRGSGGA